MLATSHHRSIQVLTSSFALQSIVYQCHTFRIFQNQFLKILKVLCYPERIGHLYKWYLDKNTNHLITIACYLRERELEVELPTRASVDEITFTIGEGQP